MNIAILDYQAGNIRSVVNALAYCGYKPILTHDAGELQKADKVIIPGVGHAGKAMDFLRKQALVSCLQQLKQPVLGICLGMQLFCSYLEEGQTEGLGIFPAKVLKLPKHQLNVPHMGWNEVSNKSQEPFLGAESGTVFYFVHAYCAEIVAETTLATDYIRPFSAAMRKENYYGVQFHPEKSGTSGMELLINFLKIQ